MTRLGTILRRQTRPFRDGDRVCLTPAGQTALDAANAQDAPIPTEAMQEAPQQPAPTDAILETNEAVQSVRQAYDGPTADGQPKPEWTRGECPQCSAAIVANCYYVGGRGYLTVWECWNSLGDAPSCGYRKVL